VLVPQGFPQFFPEKNRFDGLRQKSLPLASSEPARDIIAKAAANKSLAGVHKRISNFFAYKDQPCTKKPTKR